MGSEDTEVKQESISDQKRVELKEKLGDINKKLLTMEWDKKHNQLNAGMEPKYAELKEEHDKILKKINGEEVKES
ncbi:hypothetical protein J4470_01445 [Candidatus Woesearchaeota archaeon]|nr:hypothetical protein [Candidatus Woesearchaeota archaeon]